MQRHPPLRLPLLHSLLAAVVVAAATAQQDQDHLAMGKLWTFENPPLAYLKQEYGFAPDQKWLDSLRLSALRLGERDNPWCSASFVSPQGLIMTNHHCVRDAVAKLGGETGKPSLVDDGFAATALGDEQKLEGLTVQQLVKQTDITAQVDEGIVATDDTATVAKKREANSAKIKAAADAAEPELMHQVVALYQGASQQLYAYKVWDDIRLVMAVNLQTAHFGGDPDNFTYPRWSIDFAFVRAWVNGAPADTSAHYFKWRQQGAQDGELVFVPGNPGSTNRLFTTAELEYQRDVDYPLILEQLRNGMAILRPFTEDNPALHTTLLGWENSYKAIFGIQRGLQDSSLMQQKRDAEQRFQAAVRKDPQLDAAYGKAWGELAQLAQAKRQAHIAAMFYQTGYSAILERAVAVHKVHDETLAETTRTAAREEALGSEMYGNPLTNQLLLDHFVRAQHWLPKDDPFLRAVAGPQAGAATIDWAKALTALTKSELRRDAFLKQLLEGSRDELGKSDDVGVAIGAVLWPLMRDAETAEKVVDQAIAVQGALLGKALHAVFGTSISPDATMTLRFSDGRVQGYDYNGTKAPWATTFFGLYGRSCEFDDALPFKLAAPWQQARDAIDLHKRVCFVSTNDIVGGNSGSCVVDRDLQVVGLIFDGNIESLPNDFYYTQERARAVSVHTDAIIEALTKVYALPRIAAELAGAPQGGGR
jgi:hypothetical protein